MPLKQSGFTLIELLIVMLIVGIISSFFVISINTLSKKPSTLVLNQIKSQITKAKHLSQMLNKPMRIEYFFKKEEITKEEQEKRLLQVQSFNPETYEWRINKTIDAVKLDNVAIDFGVDYIYVLPNGFVTKTDINLVLDNKNYTLETKEL